MSSTLPLALSANEVSCAPYQCPSQVYAYSYYVSSAYWSDYTPLCSCSFRPSTSIVQSFPWLLNGRAGAFCIVLLALNGFFGAVGRYCVNRVHVVLAWRHCILEDLDEARRAVVFLMCQLMFIVSTRIPVGRSRLRRLAFRYAPYALASLVTGEAVFVPGSPFATPASSRRSLAQIQAEHRVVVGGLLLWHRKRLISAARWSAGGRVRSRGRSSWRTVYNP
eukprot:6492384-Amphidinium_carterae.8